MVLDEEWGPIGTLTLPEDFRLELASVRELWGVATDQLDVPRIVRYRVPVVDPADAPSPASE